MDVRTLLFAALLAITLRPALEADVRIGAVDFSVRSLDAGPGEAAMLIVDLDADQDPELLVLSQTGTLQVFRQDGTGWLTAALVVAAGASPNDLSAGHLDQDGHLDLAIANHETHHITLLFGDGKGGFPRRRELHIDVEPHPHVAGIHDVDGDGLDDIIVDHRQGEGLLVLTGLGSGRYSDGTLVPTGGDPYLGFVAADVNGDGRLDLVTPNPRELGLAMQTASGWSESRALSVGFGPAAVGAGDTNGDGHVDLVAASGEGSANLQVLLGDGTGTFSRGPTHDMARGMKALRVGDIDGDGLSDALSATWSGTAVVARGGAGSASPENPIVLPVEGNPWGLAIGDLNGDGTNDFAVADGVEARVAVFLSRR